MNPKPIIAVDADDVLSQSAGGFIEWSNQKFGTHLTIADYDEHWAKMWKIEHDEAEQRAHEFHTSDVITTYNTVPNAFEVLTKLKERFTLVLLTSRRTSIAEMTREWINRNYPGIFSECVFCGFYDNLNADRFQLTKAGIAKDIKADYLIDDQLKHAEASAEAGITSLLFGDYPWNQKDILPPNAIRVNDWGEVLKYFELN